MPRGQKSCPVCKATCGPRTHACACGHQFFQEKRQASTTTSPVEEVTAPEPLPFWRTGKPVLFTPAGKPPAWNGNLTQWMAEVQDRFMEFDVGPTAYKYWLSRLFPDQPQVCRQLAAQIDEAFLDA